MSPHSLPPEFVIFCGIQAAGKTTFYRERFLASHVRISLDLLRTRGREQRFLDLCLETGMPVVVDNTNPTRVCRARYLSPAKAAGFRVVGYYFQSRIEECLERNARREGVARIPDAGVRGCAGRLELPTIAEGFDALNFVRIRPDGGFLVEEWTDGL